MTGSVLLHVQYLLGIGHLQRSLRIAGALADLGVAVTLVSGGEPISLPRHPAVRLVQLPPIVSRDASFQLFYPTGQPLDDARRAVRREALLESFREAQPDVVVIEGFPFARHAFRFELEPLIAAARARTPRSRVVCSVRDILILRDDPKRFRDIVRHVRRDFDTVLVHGDRMLVPLEMSFPSASEIADQLCYTGYVGPVAPSDTEAGTDQVIVSAGGGATGLTLLKTALAVSRAGYFADTTWRLFAGNRLPEADFVALGATAPANVSVERFHDNLSGLMTRCRVSVSQAGYNTVLDILRAQARAVVVPYAAGRETEQLLRADRLAALGAVELVREAELSPESLAAAMQRAASGNPAAVAVGLDGAARSAAIIAAMIAQHGGAARGLVADASRGMIGQ